MRVLITGAGGQLGAALNATAQPDITVRALPHAALDIAEPAAVERVFADFQPQLVINAAAFTAVDAAESQLEAARRVNSLGPAVLATACLRHAAWLIHVSSDYIFDGRQSTAYAPAATAKPLNAYGATKLEGELAIARVCPRQSTVVRASWLYTATGRNFVNRMLGLMAERQQLRIVRDQIGAPTCGSGLARVLWALGGLRVAGTYHWCDSGVASWYDFAVAIAEEGAALGLLKSLPDIVPVATEEYPTAARRPAFSLLDKRETEKLLNLQSVHWRTALRAVLCEVAATQMSTA